MQNSFKKVYLSILKYREFSNQKKTDGALVDFPENIDIIITASEK